ILGLHATPIIGSSRIYAYLGQELTWPRWVDAIRHGRTFVTNGPLIQFEVNGEAPGGEIQLPREGGSVELSGQLHSIAPVDRLEVYFNGRVVETIRPGKGGKEGSFRKRVPVTRSGWYTFRAITNEPHHPIDDAYVVAETSPVYVYCGDQPIRS